MKKLLALFVLIPFLAFGQQYMVQMVKGKAFVQTNDSWKSLSIKAKLESSVVRVEKDSELRLVSSDGKIMILKEGTFNLSKINQTQNNPQARALQRLKEKLGKGSSSGDGPTAVAGVRGADVYSQAKDGLKKDLYWEE